MRGWVETHIHFLSCLLALSQPRHQILNLRHRAGNQFDALRVFADLQFSQLRGLSATSQPRSISQEHMYMHPTQSQLFPHQHIHSDDPLRQSIIAAHKENTRGPSPLSPSLSKFLQLPTTRIARERNVHPCHATEFLQIIRFGKKA
jgi:hypothetical protein